LALVALAVVPFTHPFPTCRVSTFFNDHNPRDLERASSSPGLIASVRGSAAPAALLAEGAFKEDFAVSPALFIPVFSSLQHASDVSRVSSTPRRAVIQALRL
jgi:hypothetical protein